MKPIVFSKRMQSVPVMLFTLAVILAVILQVVRNLTRMGHDPSGLIPLLSLFALIGTVGWRAALRSGSPRLVLLYFAGQTALMMTLFIMEARLLNGISGGVGNLTVVLIVQAGVLAWRDRLIVLFGQLLLMVSVVAMYAPLSSVLVSAAVSLLLNAGILMAGHLIVSEEQARHAADDANRKLSEYAAQAEELAAVRERNRMAREIHDSLGHYLTVINTQIEAARTLMPTDPARANDMLARAQSLTKDGLTEIRRSVSALRETPLDARPLAEAIQQLVDEHSASGLAVSFRVAGTPRPCPAAVELALYRAAQEALTNIRRHAKATSAELVLSYNTAQVTLSVRDDGVGSAAPSGGFGLMGIQERIRLIGGRLVTETALGQGFALHIEVPA